MGKKLLLSKKGGKVVMQKMTPAMSTNKVDVGGEEYPTGLEAEVSRLLSSSKSSKKKLKLKKGY